MKDKHVPGDREHAAKLLNMSSSILFAWLSGMWGVLCRSPDGRDISWAAGWQQQSHQQQGWGGGGRKAGCEERGPKRKGAQKAENIANFQEKLQEASIFKL